ncbi:MAG: hypothetical protein K2K05_08990 [Muribaculaceae bacterium]|nr:hypothetical protein [Muribaculaceae bacterium]
MAETHRRLVDACFRVAFCSECDPSRMSDALLAALVRLRVRLINNFGLYILANPDADLTVESLEEALNALVEEALSRSQSYWELSEERATLVAALSECRRVCVDVEAVNEELARFVTDAARERRNDGVFGRTVLQLAGTVRLQASDRAFALWILRGWISSMTTDGSWPDLSDTEALERCRMMADVAIPGYVVRSELIDCCYLRYVMNENPADMHTELLRIAARCSHYTDIEVDYAEADIAFLTDVLNGDISEETSLDVYGIMFDVVYQLYALDLMENIDFDSGPDPESPGTAYPRA